MAKGFGSGELKKGKPNYTAYSDFLVKVFQVIQENDAAPQAVYPILEKNLDKLDNKFPEIFRKWSITNLRKNWEINNLGFISAFSCILVDFSNLLQHFSPNSKNIKSEVQEIAIAGYEIAFSYLEQLKDFKSCVIILRNLGNLYRVRLHGNPAENVEKAISMFQSALKIPVCTANNFPYEWASIQHGLGNAYRERIHVDNSENIKLAIAAHHQASLIFAKNEFYEEWAMAVNALGNDYMALNNFQAAIDSYKSALKIFSLDSFPRKWAMTKANLAYAYFKWHGVNKLENIELAIESFVDVLQVYNHEHFLLEWASIQSSLGSAYFYRVKDDRIQSLKLAIDAYQSALRIYNYDETPFEWALTKINLGLTYSEQIIENKSENLVAAIKAYQEALQVYTFDAFPKDWAKTQNYLGYAYYMASEWKEAIAAHQLAIKVYTFEKSPKEWAYTQNYLGNAYYGIGNLENALKAYKATAKVFSCKTFSLEWAMVKNNIGNIYREQGLVLEAIQCFQAALEIYTPSAFPQECFKTAKELGNIAFGIGKWTEASTRYAAAIDAVETSRAWAISESRRQDILAEAIDVYENMVQACINAGQLEKAIETVERSRSKRLVDLMASNDLYQGDEILPKVKELLQQFDDLQQRIDQERSQNNSGNNRELMAVGSSRSDRATFQAYNEAIASLEAEKQQLWNQIRSKDPVLAGEIQVNAPDFSAMQNLIDQPTTAILSIYTTSHDTHIFVLRQNQITLHTCTGQGLETLQAWIFQNWLKPYVEDRNTWQSEISSFLEELAQRLQISSLIAQHLEGITELILVPHLALHQIPLAALPIGNAQYLGDKFLIRYTPSCQILEFCQQRGEVKDNLSYGIVEDATDDLPCASFEGEQIAQLHQISNNQRLRGSSQATRDKYRQLAKQVQVLHSCHHAESCLDNPLNSQLKLGDGSITLGQLMTPGWRLPKLSDVFLSCCETGLGLPKITDDILTLSTGFLCAGARSVVSTLWSVGDLATALFSIFYYQHRQQGQNRPQALQQAQIKLRQLSKEEFVSREDIKELYEQAKARKETADKKRKQYQRGSAECVRWTREYLKYRKIQTQISTIENSVDGFPFSNPCYWAAFTCQGLR